MTSKETVLLVDDEPNNLRALKIDLEDTGYTLLTANDGLEAWERLEQSKGKVSCILLDRMMPNMNGMEFMEKLKAHPDYSSIPVIMQTAAAEREQVVQGIQAGVYYYMTKPYDKHIMLSILDSAIRDYGHYSELRKNLKQFKSKLKLVRSSTFEVSSLDEIEYLSTFLANFFPVPERVVLGISELILNAHEHGNLGITYDEKTELFHEGVWEKEVYRREQLPENQDKFVIIEYKKTQTHVELRIIDQGTGFNWKDYMEISPERATHNHGRGIAVSKMVSFDTIEYMGCGNEVLCTVKL